MKCSRCETAEATRHQEYRHESDRLNWPNNVTDRCERCAQALREYCALPTIGSTIVVDVPLSKSNGRVTAGDLLTSEAIRMAIETHPFDLASRLLWMSKQRDAATDENDRAVWQGAIDLTRDGVLS